MTRPPFITMTRCDSTRATARSWVTTMADNPSSLTRLRIRSSRRACTDTSRPPVGSSMNTSRGSGAGLRAICSRWGRAPGRLVHEHQPRLGDEIARDLQPLAHAAGIGFGCIVDAVEANLDPLQPG